MDLVRQSIVQRHRPLVRNLCVARRGLKSHYKRSTSLGYLHTHQRVLFLPRLFATPPATLIMPVATIHRAVEILASEDTLSWSNFTSAVDAGYEERQ